jgi:hypothetical protein
MVVCYLPLFFIGDSAGFGGGFYDDAWYHRWHVRLLDAMTANKNVSFVWKGLPSVDEVPDPVPGILKTGSAPNVRYETRPFTRVLPEVDRVIVDFPSTALYEAVTFEKPVLALSFKRFTPLRPRAMEAFAPILRVCESEDEALDRVSEFLTTEARRWILDPSRVLP